MCGVKYGQCVRLIKFKMDLITVIIPCYNSGKTLQRAVDSVLNQTFEKIELIIINDGSNDTKTIKILKTIKDAIIINQKNSGLASARNRGFREAKGNYLVFLDADDWLSKNAISYMLKAIKKSSSKYVLCSSLLEGDREGIYSRHYNFFEQLFINHVHYFMLIEHNLKHEHNFFVVFLTPKFLLDFLYLIFFLLTLVWLENFFLSNRTALHKC